MGDEIERATERDRGGFGEERWNEMRDGMRGEDRKMAGEQRVWHAAYSNSKTTLRA